MSQLFLYAPSVVLMLGAAVTSICSAPVLIGVGVVLTVGSVLLHLREVRRRHRLGRDA